MLVVVSTNDLNIFSLHLPEWVELLANILAKLSNIQSSKNMLPENVLAYGDMPGTDFDLNLFANIFANWGKSCEICMKFSMLAKNVAEYSQASMIFKHSEEPMRSCWYFKDISHSLQADKGEG